MVCFQALVVKGFFFFKFLLFFLSCVEPVLGNLVGMIGLSGFAIYSNS